MSELQNRVGWLREDVVVLPSAVDEPAAFSNRAQMVQDALFFPDKVQRVRQELTWNTRADSDPKLLFYWAVARASATVMELVKEKDENYVSTNFLTELGKEIGLANAFFGTQLCVAYDSIFANVGEDAVLEAVSGADVLFVFQGDNLVPARGFRLVWVQFKHCRLKEKRWQLDVYNAPNKTEVPQFVALNRMNDDSGRAVSIYALGHSERNYYGAVRAADITGIDAADSTKSRFDLGNGKGVRLQELLTELATSVNQESFKSAQEVIEYLEVRIERATFLRLHVVGVFNGSGPALDAMRALVADIKVVAKARADEVAKDLKEGQTSSTKANAFGPDAGAPSVQDETTVTPRKLGF